MRVEKTYSYLFGHIFYWVKYMLKFIFNVVKKLILGLLLLYAYNMIVYPLNATIPMNIFTIVFVTILGFPGMLGLCLFSLFIL